MGPIVALERSPFFDDILLSVGDWSFQIWREGEATPLFQSGYAADYCTAGMGRQEQEGRAMGGAGRRGQSKGEGAKGGIESRGEVKAFPLGLCSILLRRG